MFAEVVGQEHVTDPLSIALDTGRINHAYLFSGPRGCGKTSSARILARSLNCVQGPTSTPCGNCPSCVALGPGGHGNLDVIELDAASHGGVDDTRELRDRAFYAPAESRYRVFIIDEAHMVTTAGFNALLKIVEEPPAHLIFIFATTEPDKVLPTIRSRTHHYPFRLLPPSIMRDLLGRVCEQEGISVDEAVYPLVIRAGGGSPRDSLSVLDQLLAGAGPEGVTYARAVALLGVTDVVLIDDAVEALATDDGAALFGTVDRVMQAGHDPRRFAVDLLDRFRDLILLRAVPEATERGLVTGPGDVLDRMREQAERSGSATLTRYAELLHEALGEMRGATAPRLLLEVVCARMLLPSVTDAESATLQRLERLERGLGGRSSDALPGGSSPPVTPSESPAPRAPESAPSRRRGAEALAAMRRESREQGSARGDATAGRARQDAVDVPDVDAAGPSRTAGAGASPGGATAQGALSDHPSGSSQVVSAESVAHDESTGALRGDDLLRVVEGSWAEIRAKVREFGAAVQAMLAGAAVARVEDTVIVFAHQHAPLAQRLSDPRNLEAVRAATRAVLGHDYDVRWEVAAPAPRGVPARSAAAGNRTHESAGSRVAGRGESGHPAGPAGADTTTPRFSRPSQAKNRAQPIEPVDEDRVGSPNPYADDDIPPPDYPDLPDDPRPVDSAPHYAPPPDGGSTTRSGWGEPGFIPASTPEEEQEMLAAAAEPVASSDRRDPDEVALELLKSELGATPLDG